MDDVQLVTDAYRRCWQQSRERHDSWIDGRLDPLARRFYIVVSATERCLAGGVASLLEERRFTLAETAEAFGSFGLDRHAAAVRELAALVGIHELARARRERGRDLNAVELSAADADWLNREFPMSQADEDQVWRALADAIRGRPDVFSVRGDVV